MQEFLQGQQAQQEQPLQTNVQGEGMNPTDVSHQMAQQQQAEHEQPEVNQLSMEQLKTLTVDELLSMSILEIGLTPERFIFPNCFVSGEIKESSISEADEDGTRIITVTHEVSQVTSLVFTDAKNTPSEAEQETTLAKLNEEMPQVFTDRFKLSATDPEAMVKAQRRFNSNYIGVALATNVLGVVQLINDLPLFGYTAMQIEYSKFKPKDSDSEIELNKIKNPQDTAWVRRVSEQ